MVELQHWHPVSSAGDLQQTPLAVQLLGRDLVLWRDDTGAPQAFADQCPHRGARLSLGRVVQGRLECAYHGWQFAAGGQCVKVPALPTFVPPATHGAKAFDVREAQGLVWLRLKAGHVAPPTFEAENDAGLRKINCGPYDVATSAPRIVENFLDMSHFGFVHEGWLGTRDATAIDDYQVAPTASGISATGCKAWQPQASVHATGPAQVEYTYEVTGPYTAVLTKVPEAGTTAVANWRESIALYVCPLTPETSRVWFRLAVADFDSPDAKLQAFQHTIFTQDRPVLESQVPKRLPLDLRAELHTTADKASSAYRRFLKGSGITFGVC
jgi:phenylpropionate dioxygenase-like ring-hydroxylating dioxygenase large terminal subunit